MLYGWEHIDYTGQRYGPYYGPAIYGKLPTGLSGTSSVNITNTTKNAGDLLRVCQEINFNVVSL